MTPVTLERAREVRPRVAALLAELPELVGVGVTFLGEGFAVKVNFRRMPECEIPAELDGVPLVVEVVGSIRAG